MDPSPSIIEDSIVEVTTSSPTRTFITRNGELFILQGLTKTIQVYSLHPFKRINQIFLKDEGFVGIWYIEPTDDILLQRTITDDLLSPGLTDEGSESTGKRGDQFILLRNWRPKEVSDDRYSQLILFPETLHTGTGFDFPRETGKGITAYLIASFKPGSSPAAHISEDYFLIVSKNILLVGQAENPPTIRNMTFLPDTSLPKVSSLYEKTLAVCINSCLFVLTLSSEKPSFLCWNQGFDCFELDHQLSLNIGVLGNNPLHLFQSIPNPSNPLYISTVYRSNLPFEPTSLTFLASKCILLTSPHGSTTFVIDEEGNLVPSLFADSPDSRLVTLGTDIVYILTEDSVSFYPSPVYFNSYVRSSALSPISAIKLPDITSISSSGSHLALVSEVDNQGTVRVLKVKSADQLRNITADFLFLRETDDDFASQVYSSTLTLFSSKRYEEGLCLIDKLVRSNPSEDTLRKVIEISKAAPRMATEKFTKSILQYTLSLHPSVLSPLLPYLLQQFPDYIPFKIIYEKDASCISKIDTSLLHPDTLKTLSPESQSTCRPNPYSITCQQTNDRVKEHMSLQMSPISNPLPSLEEECTQLHRADESILQLLATIESQTMKNLFLNEKAI